MIVSANIFAETHWEVAILFLGKNEDTQFQKDIANNISEIKSIKANSNFLKVTYFNETKSTSSEDMSAYLKNAFSANALTKKALVIYSHGLGPEGLKDFNVEELKEDILNNIPHLDLLWFDACFMANIEFLFEVKNYSDFSIASEDAEFSSGLPFESIENLVNFAEASKAAGYLASEFLNSYSYIKNGVQRDNVQASSATISVIENSKLLTFVKGLKQVKKIYSLMDSDSQEFIISKSKRNYSMDQNDLFDLGHFLIDMRSEIQDEKSDKVLTGMIRKLNIQSTQAIKSNPRVKIKTPLLKNTIFVWGFDNFKQGYEADYKENPEIYSELLKPDGFILGPNNKKWPYKKMHGQRLTITPFAPGLNEFNYYVIENNSLPKATDIKSISRATDLIETYRTQIDSPLLYSGYTQEIGHRAERYTGLNISSPLTVPSIDYFTSEFNQLVDWLKL